MNDTRIETCDAELETDLSDEALDRSESQFRFNTIGGTHACHIDAAD